MKDLWVHCGHWRLKELLYYEDQRVHIEAGGFEEDDTIKFSGRFRKDLYKMMENWFCKQIQLGNVPHLMRRGYIITYKGPKIFLDVRHSMIAYHTTERKNRKSILQNGLFPNPSMASKEVQNASQILDNIKPKWIPDWVKRTNALYLYPEITVDFLFMIGYPSSDLYAVKLPHNRGWMGSQLYGGFCLSECPMEEMDQETLQFIKEDVGKKYWNYSCSLEDYII